MHFFVISRLSTTYKQNSITRKSPAAGWVMMRADRSLAYSHQQQKNNKSDNNPSKIIALRCSRLFIAMSTHTLYSDQNGKSIFPLTCWERYLRAQHLCRLSPCVYIRSDMAEQQTSYKIRLKSGAKCWIGFAAGDLWNALWQRRAKVRIWIVTNWLSKLM